MSKEKELHELQENYKRFEEKMEYNRMILQELEKENKKEKVNLKETLYLRKNFLLNLLKQGLDSGFFLDFYKK